MQTLPLLLPLLLALVHPSSGDLTSQTCTDSGTSTVIEPDAQAVLGGIMTFRLAGLDGGCGAVDGNVAELVEAIRWSLQRLNQDSGSINGETIRQSYVPGIKIGAVIKDSCDNDDAVVTLAKEFLPNKYSLPDSCTVDQNKLFLGFLGEAYSSRSIPLASLAGKYGVPVISPSATAGGLSDTSLYPTFLRTIATDDYQAKVMVEMIKELAWERFAVVYEDDIYGRDGLKSLTTEANKLGLCVATAVQIKERETSKSAYEAAASKLTATGVTGVVYFGSLDVAKRLLSYAANVPNAGQLQWIFSESFGTNAPQDNIAYFKGSIMTSTAQRNVAEFEDHWVRIDPNNPSDENPYYKEWYMDKYRCRLSGVTDQPYAGYPACPTMTEAQRRQLYTVGKSAYTESTILSVFAYAKALKNMHRQMCGGAPGLCNALRNIDHEDFYNNYLLPLDMTFTNEERVPTLASNSIAPWNSAKRISFDDYGDIEYAAYSVWNYKNTGAGFEFVQVGSYLNRQLQFNKQQLTFYNEARTQALISIPASNCPPGGCKNCYSPDVFSYAYSPGDILIGAVFPLHTAGENGFSCGELDPNGLQLLEAFMYGLKQVTADSILSGVQIGGIAFDSCSSATLAQNRISNFQSGVEKAMDASGSEVSPGSVRLFLGADTLESGKAESMVLNEYSMPLIGYGSKASELSDMEKFPLFARTMINQEAEIKLAIMILKELGISFVQQVHVDNEYGHSFAKQFKMHAAKERICVAATNPISARVADALMENPDASVVITWADMHNALNDFVQLLAQSDAYNKFTLIGGRSWTGDIDRSNSRVRDVLQNSLSWVYKTPVLNEYRTYLQNIDIRQYAANPWFAKWYQETFSCYLDPSNKDGFTQECQSTAISSAPDFELNNGAVFVINAVYTAAHAMDMTLKHFCGDQYSSLCSNYVTATNRSQVFMEKVYATSFEDDSRQTVKMVDGSGSWPLEIFSMRNLQSTFVGTYTPGGMFEFSTVGVMPLTTTCPGTCPVCNYVALASESVFQDGDFIIGGLFDIHHSGPSPFSCGDVRMDRSYQYSEAFLYAIDRVNKNEAPVSLKGLTLGALGFDQCSSGLRAASLVSEVHAGASKVDNLDPEKIIGWMTRNTAESLEVADVTRGLGLPQVGMTATSPQLMDPNRSPTFFYSLSSDDVMARGMVRVAQQKGWYYIQTLNVPSVWGRSNVEALERAAGDLDICIVNQLELGSGGGDVDYEDVVNSLITSATDVVAVFAELGDVRKLLEAKNRIGNPARKLTFLTSELYGDLDGLSTGIATATRGLITFKINSPKVDDFTDHMEDKYPGVYMGNPWFDDYYQAVFECDLPGESQYDTPCDAPESTSILASPKYQQEFLLINSMNAVYMITDGLDRTLKMYCGENYDGQCEAFTDADPQMIYKTLMEQMELANFTDPSGARFTLQNRQYDQGYTIYAYENDGSYEEIGTFKQAGLRMTGTGPDNFYRTLDIDCGTKCAHCEMVEQRIEKFTYIPGDILLGGIFDVHKSGGSPFTCGELTTRKGFQLLEAFNYAIDYVNEEMGIFDGKLNGVTLGGVALDACSSPTRAGNLVANIHSGFLSLEKDGEQVDPARINAYIGPYYSDSSVQVADVLSKLTVPQISYGSTSIMLKDRELYPYFLRTVPADDKQASAIVALLRKLKLTYVQVVYSPGTYGEQATKEFTRQASFKGICVALSTSISEDPVLTTDEANNAVQKMLSKPNARAVVTFLNTAHIRPFLQAIRDNARDRFMFIGSEAWANYRDLTQGYEDIVRNSITMGVETSDLSDFDRYLKDKNPNNYFANPWFAEYYESVFQCSLSGGSAKYPDVCTDTVQSIVSADGYVQDNYAIYTTNAVFAAAEGIHRTLEAYCGDNYNGLCESFRSSAGRRQRIFDEIKKVEFVDESEQVFQFTDEQESNRGYHIYFITTDSGRLEYRNIGSFNTTHLLRIDTTFRLAFESDCSEAGSCTECSQLVNHDTTKIMERPSPKGLNIAAFFNIHHAHPEDPFRCGKLDQGNFQLALAFFYAMDQINNDNVLGLDADIKLGGIAIDVCGNSLAATRDLYSLVSGQGLCHSESEISPSDILAYNLNTNTSDAIVFQQALSPLKVLTMTASVSSPELSNKQYFLRTLPSDSLTMHIMVELARQMEWPYVSVVASDGQYWSSSSDGFIAAARGDGSDSLCIGSKHTLPDDATLTDATDLVRELYGLMGDSAVFLFTSPEHTKLILEATQKLELDGKLVFVGGDSFAQSQDAISGIMDAAQGSLAIWLDTPPVAGFIEWMSKLNVADHGDIPDDWFEEFWQATLECRLENATVVATQYRRTCLRTYTLEDALKEDSDFLLSMIISVQIVAQGLGNIQQCIGDPKGFSDCLAQLDDRRQEIYDKVKDSEWSSPRGLLPPGETVDFKFTEEGNGHLKYNILNVQRTENGGYEYKEIGSYGTELIISKDDYRDANDDSKTVPSACLASKVCRCLAGTGINGSDTGGHKDGTEPGGPTTGERKSQREEFDEIWMKVLAALAGLGICVTVLMGVYLIIFYPVKGGTSAVGYLLLFTVLLIYILTFAFIIYPSVEDCGIRRFCLGVVFALAFACMLVKVLNTWRIGDTFDEYDLPQYKRLSHPCSLFFIALGITMVQVIIGIMWLVLRHPDAEDVTLEEDGKERVWSICTEASFHYEELIISVVYVMFLILMTFIFSIVTWDSQENHKESRWICITSCFSIAIWIVWTTIVALAPQRFRDPALAIACVANATIILLCIFVRKLWLMNKYDKEIEEEKSRMSTLSRDNKHDNGIHTNPMYLYVDNASISGNSNIVYHAPRSPGGADVVY